MLFPRTLSAPYAMPHPTDAVPGPVIQPSAFSLGENPFAIANQASTTLLVKAAEGYALGSNGETQAVAKSKVSSFGTPNGAAEADELRKVSAALFEDYRPMGEDGKFIKQRTRGEDGEIQGMFYNPTLGGDRGLLTRQVASYQADQLLGLNMVSEEKFGVDQHGNVLGMSVLADGGGAMVAGKSLLNVNYSRPEIQRGLSDLQVSDFITGQVDRNPNNIFIDPVTGKVTGIDNDLAFPEVSREEVFARRDAPGDCGQDPGRGP
jgi:hypothetical protein